MNIIFSDGASRGNPGPGGYGVIVVLGDTVTELGGREESTTNNRMELRGVIEGLSVCVEKQTGEVVTIYTDSSYVINGITKWVSGWQKNGWKTKTKADVLNRDLWEQLLLLTKACIPQWKLLPGHAGIPGNERCDEIATTYADGNYPILYQGSVKNYTVSLSISPDAHKVSSKEKSSAKAYSYVSVVDGTVMTHATWAECETRVKGVRGARYRKALSPEEEKELIDSWNTTP